MREVVLITGSHGMVAAALRKRLEGDYCLRFLTRRKEKEDEFEWDISRGYIDEDALIGVDHIIHLAGAGIADKRWTAKRKKEIISSRVGSARLILEFLITNNLEVASFISASAVGYYGSEMTEAIYKEEDAVGDDFLAEVVWQWEAVAKEFLRKGKAKRVVITRNGVVLSGEGGALRKMTLPIRYLVGAVIGSGKQYMPWIHIDDLCYLYEYILKHKHVNGIFNAVAPTHVNNEELTFKCAKVLKRPIILPNIPSFVMKILFGEMSIALLGGSRVSCEKLLAMGFDFRFEDIDRALNDVL